jgi:hypothetical protein
MDHGKKLLELLGVSSLPEYIEPASFDDIMKTGDYYLRLFERAFVQNEMQPERIRAETARNLAEMMQPDGRTRFGAADESAMRQLLSEAGAEEEWDRQMSILKQGVGRSGLDPEQQSAFLEGMEEFKHSFFRAISSEAARLRLVPVENIGEMSLALAEMMREDDHADQSTDN